MDAETVVTLAFGVAILASLWNLHRDIAILRKDLSGACKALGKDLNDLHNRVARVEGMLAGAGLKVVPDPASG